MTRKSVIKRIKELFQEYEIGYEMNEHAGGGHAYSRDGFVVVGIAEHVPSQRIASCAVHELSHILCWRNGKFKEYHNVGRKDKRITTKRAYITIKTGLRAERYVDKIAAKLFKKYFPEMKYMPGYSEEWQVKWLKSYHELFRDVLKKRAKKYGIKKKARK